MGSQRLRTKHVREILRHWTQHPLSETAESQHGLSQTDTVISLSVSRWVGIIVRQARWVTLKGRILPPPKKKKKIKIIYSKFLKEK